MARIFRVSAAKAAPGGAALFVQKSSENPIAKTGFRCYSMAVPRKQPAHKLIFGGLTAMHYDPRDMTHGNLWKQILIFSLPLMASNLLQVLFNMSDIAVVGKREAT